ncbi:hypothetical protein NESM_000841300 [Novymonas esmeraldas]|uniref:Uncharacterized protein n=1 Tax=Novymonas esmeraldas TaxID=1808958 RepID=A0AAW0EXL7_9TRYP
MPIAKPNGAVRRRHHPPARLSAGHVCAAAARAALKLSRAAGPMASTSAPKAEPVRSTRSAGAPNSMARPWSMTSTAS